MWLQLQAIQFNHDSSSTSADAFNIRKNEREFIEIPEWRYGKLKPEDSPAAYARHETQGNTLTIKANFCFEGVEKQELLIRALDANFHQEPISGSNLWPAEVRLLTGLTPNPQGNVLGAVKATPIAMSAGETGFQPFELESVRIQDAGVGRHDIVWRWQYWFSGLDKWRDLAVTTHRIYTTLQVPQLPWVQADHAACNTQLPWVEVLEHACDWARGTKNTDDAAERITFRVNDLGRQKLVCYRSGPAYTDVKAFDCSSFLALLRGEPGKGGAVNCDDCASIVSTFANSVGCDLQQMCITSDKFSFDVKPHVRIGIDGTFENQAFTHHMVAAEGGCGVDVEVFDACLQLVSGDLTKPAVFELPTNLAFSTKGSGYHCRLVIDKEQDKTHPHPNCKRRRLGPADGVEEECVDAAVVEEHFEFPLFKESNTPGNRFFISDFFFAKYIVPSLQPAAVQESKPGATRRSIHSLWTSAVCGEGKPFRIDLYETASWRDARLALIKILATLAEPTLVRQQIEGIGDVTFADRAFENILFAAGNLVFYLKTLCHNVGPLTDVGRRITEKILNAPQEPIEDSPDAGKRFSFAGTDGLVGTKIRLREEPASPLAPPRLYQFLAEAGEVSRENGQLMYRPGAAGIQTLKIFAVDQQGNAVQQKLQLSVT